MAKEWAETDKGKAKKSSALPMPASASLAAPVLEADKPAKPTQAKPVKETKPDPVFGDRVIKISLTPTRGHDGTVVKLIKDFPRAPWSDGVQENWGLQIDEGHREHPISAVTLNLLKQRQEVNLQPIGVEDMPAAIDKYLALGWVIEDGPNR